MSKNNDTPEQPKFDNVDPEVKKYIDLINVIRDNKDKKGKSHVKAYHMAFEHIVSLLDDRIKKMVRRERIKGLEKEDIYQEALYALKFKAIKDYNEFKGKDPTKPAPFDRFALFCIKRHLSTKRHASRQNKSRVVNEAVSLNQETNSNTEDLSLINILYYPNADKDLLAGFEKREKFKILMSKLMNELSDLEKQVLYLYAKGKSYEEMAQDLAEWMNEEDLPSKKIDNALSRIKFKAEIVFKRIDPDGWRYAAEQREKKKKDKDA